MDTFLEVIQRKVLKGMHLPMVVKEIQAGHLCSPYFKDIYLYLSQNKLPSSKSSNQKIRNLGRKICFARFIIVQNIIRKRDSSPSSTSQKHAQTRL